MKRVLSVLIAALFLLTAVPMLVQAADVTVTVLHNDGGITGYNTTGSSTEFTEIASGGTFKVGAGGGLTVGALPNGGYTVTEIYINEAPADPNLVYFSRDGAFVVDHGDVNADETIRFVFAPSNGNTPFDARGEEPGGPSGEPCYITVKYNAGGSVGYNTTGSSTEFTAIKSGDNFEVFEHSGMTIGAMPNEGYTVTEIYLDEQLINPDWVYIAEGGRFVVDYGDVDKGYEVRFVFDTADGHDPYPALGQPPFGPGDPDQPSEPVYDSRILFSLEDDFGWYIEAVFGSTGAGFVNEEHLLEIPCTSGADVRVRIEPQQKNDPEYGDYYPHLGSMVITDQNGNEVRPYYRMNDVTPENDPTRFTFETTIQNVQGEVHVTLSKGDEWHGTIINDFLSEELSFLKADKQLDNEITIDLTTGEKTFLPELANMMGGKGVYQIGDLPAEIASDLIAIGFSANDDFIEVTENEYGDAVNVTLLLSFDKPFEKTWTGEYGEWHEETETVKVLVNMKGNEPNFDTDAMNNDLVQAQFDTNAGETFDLRFDYMGVKSQVQRRDVLHINLHTDAGFLYGDANRDGNVDMKDVLIIRKYIAHLIKEEDINFPAADVNFDGSVDMKDVLLIRKFISHLIDGFGEPPASQDVSLDAFELPPMPL